MTNWNNCTGVDALLWNKQLATLNGASVYQTHGWGEVKRRLGWAILRLVMGTPEAPIAMAQVLVRRYPLGGAVCWIPGGVAGDVMSWAPDLGNALRKITKAKWLYVRMNSMAKASPESESAMNKEGWCRPSVRFGSGQSLCYQPSADQQERLARMSGNWRHNLKRSGKYGLQLRQWHHPDIAELRKLYRSMEELKNLPEQMSETELRAMFECFHEHIVCYRCDDKEGNLLAIRACALFSDGALDLLAAASPEARKQYASHATLWALLEDCAQRGVVSYDMGGADPVRNKGVFDFKHGVGAVPFSYFGEWEWVSHGVIRLPANWAIRRRGKLQ